MQKTITIGEQKKQIDDYEDIAIEIAISYKKYYDIYKRNSGKHSNLFYVKKDQSSNDKIKNHKWFEAFLITAKRYGIQDDFNPEYFVRAIFEKNGFVYPHQLKTQRSWNDYKDLIKIYKEKEQEAKIPFIKKVVPKCSRTFSLLKYLGGATNFIDKNKNLILNNSIEIFPLIYSKNFRDWISRTQEESLETTMKIRKIISITIPLINNSEDLEERNKIKKEIMDSLGPDDYTEEVWNI